MSLKQLAAENEPEALRKLHGLIVDSSPQLIDAFNEDPRGLLALIVGGNILYQQRM